ncbi:hypothetical protein RICGR_0005 [Rickettsiella grylli]|uniref:Uncharacterized protein n=1 Tax=Rickettsiella grylli TaxID=59196 RepID=A8PK17_9COXI|nr:hypothetical protein RICGR_1539 [Rickettsiella grylli]EDP45968.1 hypothetical protein RICGR_0005 [Rickettsiella grylli]
MINSLLNFLEKYIEGILRDKMKAYKINRKITEKINLDLIGSMLIEKI